MGRECVIASACGRIRRFISRARRWTCCSTPPRSCAGRHAVGVLLTGMGRDGAQGMQQLKSAGAINLAQNEATCVVYGMPRAAVELGVVDRVLPLDHMPHAIIHALRERAAKPAVGAPATKINL